MKRKHAVRNGEWLFVVRPADPWKAIETIREIVRRLESKEITQKDSELLFNAALCSQPYFFVGYYSSCGKRLLDAKGWTIGKMKRGDSHVGFELVKEQPEIGAQVVFYDPNDMPETPAVEVKVEGT